MSDSYGIEGYFQSLRHSSFHHIGLGDVRMTVAQQEEVSGWFNDLKAEANRLRAEKEECERQYQEQVRLLAVELDLRLKADASVRELEGRDIRLSWSPVTPPNSECSYHHTEATTPFGTFLLTWKGWKTEPWQSKGICFDETPWGEVWREWWDTPEQAQRDAEFEYSRRLRAALANSEKED